MCIVVPWVGAVLDGFLPVFPPFVAILCKKAVPTGLDLERLLVLHLAQYLRLRGENPNKTTQQHTHTGEFIIIIIYTWIGKMDDIYTYTGGLVETTPAEL